MKVICKDTLICIGTHGYCEHENLHTHLGEACNCPCGDNTDICCVECDKDKLTAALVASRIQGKQKRIL